MVSASYFSSLEKFVFSITPRLEIIKEPLCYDRGCGKCFRVTKHANQIREVMQNRNLNKIIKLYFLFFILLSEMNVCFAADSIELVHSLTEEELSERNSQESLLNRELVYGTILFDPPKERPSSEFLPIKFGNINPKESFEERLKIMNFTEQEEE